MAFHIRDPATDEAVRRLAKLKGKSLTETVREAVENEYRRECKDRGVPLTEQIRLIQEWVKARSKGPGLPADKAFYDELSGEF
ncbi:MAG: type II toxin-antitoxin system VapB family antitoxin [Alphaproteobacteria bacterium]